MQPEGNLAAVSAALGERLTPGRIGAVALRNRLVLPAKITGFADATGEATEPMVRYCEALARGGAGLVVIEHAASDSPSRRRDPVLALDDDRVVSRLRQLAGRVHAAGAAAAIAIAGAVLPVTAGPAGDDASPYKMPHRRRGRGATPPDRPPTISRADLARCVEAHCAAARRAALAGFDLVELPVCGGRLLGQFLEGGAPGCPDEYQGTLENRARLLLDLLRRLRCDLPGLGIVVRLAAPDRHSGSLDPEESVRVARWAAATGAAAIHVTSHVTSGRAAARWRPRLAFPRRPVLRGRFLDHAARLRGEIAVPVIVGPVGDEAAAAVLAAGKADFVMLAGVPGGGRQRKNPSAIPQPQRER